MDPLDRLNIPTPPVSSAEGDSSPDAPMPAGYGHMPYADPNSTGSGGGQFPALRTQARRDVFWSNVVREILMALASAAAASSGRLDIGPAAANASTSPVDDLFDGRMGLITTLGQRIPIADITPVFACSMPSCDADRSRSADVQCTVFRVSTPTGESYTLPISQIIGVHSISESLMDQLEFDEEEGESEEGRVPFGFGAYTSLAQSENEEENRMHTGSDETSGN